MMRRLSLVDVAGSTLGVSVEETREVLRAPQVVPVPRAPAGVRGLLNLRGQVLPVIDPLGAEGMACALVLRTAARGAVLLVDRVHGIETLAPDRFEAVPPTLGARLARWARGSISLGGRLVIWIDAGRMIEEAVSVEVAAREADRGTSRMTPDVTLLGGARA